MRKTLSGAVLVLACAWVAQAQVPEKPDAAVIDLAECREIATRNNRDLRRSSNALARAVAGEAIAESDVFSPDFNASQTFTEENDFGDARAELTYLTPYGVEVIPYITAANNNDSTDPWSNGIGVTLKRRLFAASERWRLRLPLTRAERDLLKATNSLQRRQRELQFEVMEAFMAVQRVQNRIRVRRERVKDAKEFLTVTRERVDNGLAPKVDIVNSQINLNQAEADLLNEETNLKSRTDGLLNVIGWSLDRELSIKPHQVDTVDNTAFDLEQDSRLLRRAHENLVNTRLDVSFAEIELAIQEDRLRPRIDLSLTAEHERTGDDLIGGRDPGNDPVRLEISYSTTLDGKKADKARLEQRRLSLQDLQTDLIDAEHRLLIRLRSAHRTIERLRIRAQLNEQRLQAEREKLAATIVRYDDGSVDNLEVTRAKQAVDDAEINLIDTRIDLALAIEEYQSLLPPRKDVKTELSAP
jgi:outer membrane protein TolC